MIFVRMSGSQCATPRRNYWVLGERIKIALHGLVWFSSVIRRNFEGSFRGCITQPMHQRRNSGWNSESFTSRRDLSVRAFKISNIENHEICSSYRIINHNLQWEIIRIKLLPDQTWHPRGRQSRRTSRYLESTEISRCNAKARYEIAIIHRCVLRKLSSNV